MHISEEEKEIRDAFNYLLKSCKGCHREISADLVKQAFEFASHAHANMRRRNNQPYIRYLLDLAIAIVDEIGLGPKSIACALLSKIVEKTEYTLEDINKRFGNYIASVIQRLGKITDNVALTHTPEHAELLKQVLLHIREDPRVILIKLTDRLLNMRTLEVLAPEKQLAISEESMSFYAPLAHRLGLNAVKMELEDLSFKYRNPRLYEEIAEARENDKRKTLHFFNRFALRIINDLNDCGYDYDIQNRQKSIYSTWQKMQKKNIPLDEVYDKLAVRIVFEPKKGDKTEEEQCEDIYNIITKHYTPNPKRKRDWLRTPKTNGYQALHGTVMSKQGKWVEVQIRSTRMHEIAERGLAAHWAYKHGDYYGKNRDSVVNKWLHDVQQTLSNPDSDVFDLLDTFDSENYAKEIAVFTPKGDIKTLPAQSSVLDFAFEVHTEIALHCIGAKVNQKLVPLSHKLKSGDQVEVLYSKNQNPKLEWFNHVQTPRAFTGLRTALKKERRKKIKRGQRILETIAKKNKRRLNGKIISKITNELKTREPYTDLNLKRNEKLFFYIGMDTIPKDELEAALKKRTKKKDINCFQIKVKTLIKKKKATPISELKTDDDNQIKNQYRLAECCHPIPGEEAECVINNKDNWVVVHKKKCHILSHIPENAKTPVEWYQETQTGYLGRIELKGGDDGLLLSRIMNRIGLYTKLNIRAVNIETIDGVLNGTIDVYAIEIDELLSKLTEHLETIDGIYFARRIKDFD